MPCVGLWCWTLGWLVVRVVSKPMGHTDSFTPCLLVNILLPYQGTVPEELYTRLARDGPVEVP